MNRIDVVLPAHNEADSIGETLTEFYRVANGKHGIPIRFVVCEDGSRDATVEVVTDLIGQMPIKLLSSPERKGYSRAVVDGLRETESDIVAFIDSDGQCDPEDLPRLLDSLDGHHLVMGRRTPRRDPWIRLAMSGAFKTAYRLLFPVPVGDPSCPYLVVTQPALRTVLSGSPGVLPQGFWWEFLARATAAQLSIAEAPVNHRLRISGSTRVYRPTKVPGVAARHLRALLTLRSELRTRARGTQSAVELPPVWTKVRLTGTHPDTARTGNA